MADDSGSNAVLGVVVGAILVAVLVLFFVVGMPGGGGDTSPDVDITIDTPDPAAPGTPNTD